MIKKIINKNYEIYINKDILNIKYYNKICDVLENKIELILENKKIIINGESLIIINIDEYEVSIKGNIKNIELINE